MLYIIIGIIIAIIIIMIVIYNNLTSKKNAVENALSTIDTFLQTRLDLMTNLFLQTERALDHESEVFKSVAELRSQHNSLQKEYENKTDKRQVITIDKNVTNIRRQFSAVEERYPDLKAISTVQNAMDANINIENQINAARRNYNYNVENFRNSIQIFPNNIFAGIFGFRDKYELYKADEDAKTRTKPLYEDVYKKKYDNMLKKEESEEK